MPLSPFVRKAEFGSGVFRVGDSLSIADIAVAVQLTQLELVVGRPDAKRWPKMVSHLERVSGRPSFGPNLEICRKIVKDPIALTSDTTGDGQRARQSNF
ncbi:MAG: hypothetical protein GY725_16610 [bacterium]|nr:hypothetical protein [bacterium]